MILVVAAKEGIKPQTAEVLQILKANKTPFLIAFNKIDTISGWREGKGGLKESIEGQAVNVSQEFQESLLIFQGSLQEHGFDSDLFYEVTDFTKKIAIVPCSAKTGEGIGELLFVLSGLSQKFLKERLELSDVAKGVIFEVKKDSSISGAEAILYDGSLSKGDEIAIASFDDPVISKVRALEEIEPLSTKFKSVKTAKASTGLRLQLTNNDEVLSGMMFQKIDGNLDKIKSEFKKEVSSAIKLDKQGIIVKADSLGSLEALMTLLKQENVQVVKAGVGNIGKGDIISAKANLEINELDSIVLGFNVSIEEGLDLGNVKVLREDVVYKLIDEMREWRTKKKDDMERERLLGLATICKLEILGKYVFRNSNPAVFGVKVLGGKLKTRLSLIDENGDDVAKVKGIEHEKEKVETAEAGQEVAVSLPGTNFERRLKGIGSLYANISEKQFRQFKKNKDLLSADEMKVLQEIADIKRKKNADWGL